MLLAYQPVRSLATLNIAINQGIASAKRILPIIDNKNNLKSKIGVYFMNEKKYNFTCIHTSFFIM